MKTIAVDMEVAAGVTQSVINWQIAALINMTIVRGKATAPDQQAPVPHQPVTPPTFLPLQRHQTATAPTLATVTAAFQVSRK